MTLQMALQVHAISVTTIDVNAPLRKRSMTILQVPHLEAELGENLKSTHDTVMTTILMTAMARSRPRKSGMRRPNDVSPLMRFPESPRIMRLKSNTVPTTGGGQCAIFTQATGND